MLADNRRRPVSFGKALRTAQFGTEIRLRKLSKSAIAVLVIGAALRCWSQRKNCLGSQLVPGAQEFLKDQMNHWRSFAVGFPTIGKKSIIVGSRIAPDERSQPRGDEAAPHPGRRQNRGPGIPPDVKDLLARAEVPPCDRP